MGYGEGKKEERRAEERIQVRGNWPMTQRDPTRGNRLRLRLTTRKVERAPSRSVSLIQAKSNAVWSSLLHFSSRQDAKLCAQAPAASTAPRMDDRRGARRDRRKREEPLHLVRHARHCHLRTSATPTFGRAAAGLPPSPALPVAPMGPRVHHARAPRRSVTRWDSRSIPPKLSGFATCATRCKTFLPPPFLHAPPPLPPPPPACLHLESKNKLPTWPDSSIPWRPRSVPPPLLRL